MADGRKLPVRFSEDGSFEVDQEAIDRAEAERDDYLRKVGEETLRQRAITYKVVDFNYEDDALGVPVEVAKPYVIERDADGGLRRIEIVDAVRDSAANIRHPAVWAAINRWRQIIILTQHFTEPGYYKTAHKNWPEIARRQLLKLRSDDDAKFLIPAKREQVSVNDLWQVRWCLSAAADYDLLRYVHDALEMLPTKRLRRSDERQRFVIDYTFSELRHRGFVCNPQSVSPLPLTPSEKLRLRFKETLTPHERILAGLAGDVERCDEWKEIKPGSWIAESRLVPDPRDSNAENTGDGPKTKSELLHKFLQSSAFEPLIKQHKPPTDKVLSKVFDCWRFGVSSEVWAKRMKRSSKGGHSMSHSART